MEFTDKAEHWVLLRAALNLALAADRGAAAIRRASRATMDAAAFTRFCRGDHERIRTPGDAERLWTWCRENKFLEYAIHASAQPREAPVADALETFYATHEAQIAEFRSRGLPGFYYGYKRSFRFKDYMMRSIWRIHGDARNHFVVEELQRSSRREFLEVDFLERSQGVAISKSRRLWLMLRMGGSQQDMSDPRVICFDRVQGHPVSALAGRVLEYDRLFANAAHHSVVLLIRAEGQKASVDDYTDLEMLPRIKWREDAKRFGISQNDYRRILGIIFNEERPFWEGG